MRKLWLIRHGHPDFPLGAHMCLGRTDTPLGPLGRMQAVLLGEALRDQKPAVFASPLTRCRETAAPLGGEALLVPDLAEQDMGAGALCQTNGRASAGPARRGDAGSGSGARDARPAGMCELL